MFDSRTSVAFVIGITFLQGFAIGFMVQSEYDLSILILYATDSLFD
jgi:hypothetical protein